MRSVSKSSGLRNRLIDPQRPWIDDPADAPSGQNWVATFSDPGGETSRLHFTRAWTALFFARLIVFATPILLAAIAALREIGPDERLTPPPWTFAAFVLVTALASYIAHRRRLASAKRNRL